MKMRYGQKLTRRIKAKAVGFKRPTTRAVGALRAPRPGARTAVKVFKPTHFKLK